MKVVLFLAELLMLMPKRTFFIVCNESKFNRSGSQLRPEILWFLFTSSALQAISADVVQELISFIKILCK